MSRRKAEETVETPKVEVEEETVETPEVEEVPGTGEGEVSTPALTANKRVKISTTFDEENDTVSIEVAGGIQGKRTFNPAELPQNIKDKLLPFAVGKKLGSQGACAGKDGIEAEEAIDKVWDGLKNGDWTVRAPAGKKIIIKENELAANLAAMAGDQKEAAIAALKALNINIPE